MKLVLILHFTERTRIKDTISFHSTNLKIEVCTIHCFFLIAKLIKGYRTLLLLRVVRFTQRQVGSLFVISNLTQFVLHRVQIFQDKGFSSNSILSSATKQPRHTVRIWATKPSFPGFSNNDSFHSIYILLIFERVIKYWNLYTYKKYDNNIYLFYFFENILYDIFYIFLDYFFANL